MKFGKWKKIGKTKYGIGEEGIILLDGDQDRVLSLTKDGIGNIIFREECDGYFTVIMTAEEAKKALKEAILWIDERED